MQHNENAEEEVHRHLAEARDELPALHQSGRKPLPQGGEAVNSNWVSKFAAHSDVLGVITLPRGRSRPPEADARMRTVAVRFVLSPVHGLTYSVEQSALFGIEVSPISFPLFLGFAYRL
jgi:hypothetical protein